MKDLRPFQAYKMEIFAKKLNYQKSLTIFKKLGLEYKKRLIGESSGLISDILETIDTLGLEGCLVRVNIEKAFDFVNRYFFFKQNS